MNPAITSQDIEEAENKQEYLENEIATMTQDWQDKLTQVRDQAEKVLNEVEIKEFQTRIAILMKELEDKNKEVEIVSDQRKAIEETVDKAMNVELDLRDQTEEIDVLNNRYRKALKDKVGVYDELVKAVKQLTDRNSTFMRNEVEICRLTNLSSITKKELEQKEKLA